MSHQSSVVKVSNMYASLENFFIVVNDKNTVYLQALGADGKEAVTVRRQDISVALLPAGDRVQVHQESNGGSVKYPAYVERRTAQHRWNTGNKHSSTSNGPVLVKSLCLGCVTQCEIYV